MDRIDQLIGPKGPRWTAPRPRCPAATFPPTGFDALLAEHRKAYPRLDPEMLRRLTRAYGTLVPKILGDRREPMDLGVLFGGTLTQVRGGLPDGPRVGAHRRGRALAPHQAGP